MNQSNRIHSLDSLRALMMWLGVVLHVALNHMTMSLPFPWRDRDTSVVADMTFIFIHAFRMPVFFILAGYFVALLVNLRGYDGMLKHRLRRVALPFIIFWPLVFIATGLMVLVYLHVMTYGTLGFKPALLPKEMPGVPKFHTMHMWFIYYLLWFCLFTAAIGRVGKFIPASWKSAGERIWTTLAMNWWGFIVLALPLAAVGSFYPGGLLQADKSFIPNVADLIHNGFFFVFGWYVYRHQHLVLAHYAKNCWKYVIAGVIAFIISLALLDQLKTTAPGIPYLKWYIAFAYNSTSWLWSFALIGIFVRYLSQPNTVLQYVSESSYWVYLVHVIGTVGIGALVYGLPIGPVAKMGLNIVATTAVCLLTYQLFVRHTFIGVLLNGTRHPAQAGKVQNALA